MRGIPRNWKRFALYSSIGIVAISTILFCLFEREVILKYRWEFTGLITAVLIVGFVIACGLED